MKATSDSRLGRVVATAFLVSAMAALSPAVAAGTAGTPPEPTGRSAGYAYGWPVRPFFVQHPVRGYFGDPRIGPSASGEIVRSLHFGVDVAAPDGTPVYATISGRINVESRGVVTIVGASGVALEYWHVVPAVRSGGQAVAYQTIVGRIATPWGHVHFAERRNGVYVNPLRPGAMGPYVDNTQPTIRQVRFERAGDEIQARATSGTFDIVLGAFDMPAERVPDPAWRDLPVIPAVIRWRIVRRSGEALSGWRTAFDVRSSLPSNSFYDVYAVGTRQNRPYRRGKYRFYLARGWRSTDLPNGTYTVQVAASDSRGNSIESEQLLTIVNRP